MASENLFSSLSRRTQQRIDAVFDSVLNNPESLSREFPAGEFIPESGGFLRNDDDREFGGGFIRDEGAGGFLPDDRSSFSGGFIPGDDSDIQQKSNAQVQIPLSLVPVALQKLDLPPDDDEVLTVFRNAATGWANEVGHTPKSEGEDKYVSRDDWRSVCAVLLENTSDENSALREGVNMIESGIEFDEDADSDEYHVSEVEDEGEDEDDNYVEGPSTSTTRRRTRTTRKSSSPSPSSSSRDSRSRKLTSRQYQTCIDAYALFFPTATAEDLLNQRIMIKDIQRVANLLNEKLKAEDMLEMLGTFSTMADKSMNFDDFCRLMVAAKLA